MIDNKEIDHLWVLLSSHVGEQFQTSGRGRKPGKPFTYSIRGGEMFISSKQKSITKATVMLAYQRALTIQADQGFVKGPKQLVPGAGNYLYPVFIKLGFITPTPLTLLMRSDIMGEEKSEEDENMPRPKGSKNKKAAAANSNEALDILSNIDERIAAAEAAVTALAEELKAKRAELKQLTKTKAEAERIAAAKKAEEDKEKLLAAVEKSGKSIDEILELLK